jgi:electron transfer flavoprotein beta subunit
MHTCVCVKQTPDSNSVYIDPINGQVDYERFVQVLNPADACAVEAAVRLKEQLGGTVLALTLGPEDAEGALRAALAMGADTAIRLWNSQASVWGPFTVAAALAAYIRRGLGRGKLTPIMPDLVLCGDASSDWASGTVGPALAEMLDLQQITGVIKLNVVAGTCSINRIADMPPAYRAQSLRASTAPTRSTDPARPPETNKTGNSQLITLQVTRRLERGYRELLEAQTPLLITVTSDLNEPRYPSLPMHMAALRARIPLVDPQTLLGESLQYESDETTLLEMHTPRPRPRRIAAPDSRHSAFKRIGEIVSGGTTGRQTRLMEGTSEELAKALVEFLKSKGFVE